MRWAWWVLALVTVVALLIAALVGQAVIGGPALAWLSIAGLVALYVVFELSPDDDEER